MSLPRKRTADDFGSSQDESDDTAPTAVHQAARDLEEKEEPPKIIRNVSDEEPPKIISNASDADADVSNSFDSAVPEPLENVAGPSKELPRSPRRTKRKSKPDSNLHSEREYSSDEMESRCVPKSPKKLRLEIKEESVDSSSSGTSKHLQMDFGKVRLDSEKLLDGKDYSSGEKGESETAGNKAIGSKHFKCSDVKSDIDENASDVSVKIGALSESHENDKISKFETTGSVAIKAEEKVYDTTEVVFTEMKVANLIDAAVFNIIHKEERSPHSGISDDNETTKHDYYPKTCLEDISQNVDLVRAEHSGDTNISTDRMEYSTDVERVECSTDVEKMECTTDVEKMESSTDAERMDSSSESRTGFESIKSDSESTGVDMECKSESSVSREEMELESLSVKSTENEIIDDNSESAFAESDSISYHGNDSISDEVTIALNIGDSSKLKREPFIPRILVKNEPEDSSKTKREQTNSSILVKNEFAIGSESDSTSNEVESINESNSNETIEFQRIFSIPRIENSDTEEYDQNTGAIKVEDQIIVSTNLTSDVKKTVAPTIIEEPSNMDDKSSSKRKRSSDSDNGIEGENASNVPESTDTEKGTEASSVEFPDTNSGK